MCVCACVRVCVRVCVTLLSYGSDSFDMLQRSSTRLRLRVSGEDLLQLGEQAEQAQRRAMEAETTLAQATGAAKASAQPEQNVQPAQVV